MDCKNMNETYQLVGPPPQVSSSIKRTAKRYIAAKTRISQNNIEYFIHL